MEGKIPSPLMVNRIKQSDLKKNHGARFNSITLKKQHGSVITLSHKNMVECTSWRLDQRADLLPFARHTKQR